MLESMYQSGLNRAGIQEVCETVVHQLTCTETVTEPCLQRMQLMRKGLEDGKGLKDWAHQSCSRTEWSCPGPARETNRLHHGW